MITKSVEAGNVELCGVIRDVTKEAETIPVEAVSGGLLDDKVDGFSEVVTLSIGAFNEAALGEADAATVLLSTLNEIDGKSPISVEVAEIFDAIMVGCRQTVTGTVQNQRTIQNVRFKRASCGVTDLMFYILEMVNAANQVHLCVGRMLVGDT
jgi:hypothetical protein